MCEKVIKKHFELRKILSNYGDEYGDCIIDDICDLFGYPNTIDIEEEEE